MLVRNQILDLQRANQLRWTSVPLPAHDQLELERQFPQVLDQIANPEIFEFVWEDSGILLDEHFDTHYPAVDEWEWQEAITCPVPHPLLWVETKVRDPQFLDDRTYIWNIVRKGPRGYAATPLVFYRDMISLFGTYFELDPDGIDDDGLPGRVTVYNCLTSYAQDYEIDEFFRQADALARFFRILCLPKAQIEAFEPDEKLNRARITRGREPLAARKTVRIDAAALLGTLNGESRARHTLHLPSISAGRINAGCRMGAGQPCASAS